MPLRVKRVVNPELQHFAGKSVVELARDSGKDVIDAFFDLVLADDFRTEFMTATMNTDAGAVAEIFTHPAAVLGLSDAGAHITQFSEAGQTSQLLGHWVRERQALSLEAAVRLITSAPADIFGIPDRGRLAPGLAARHHRVRPRHDRLPRGGDRPRHAGRRAALRRASERYPVVVRQRPDGHPRRALPEPERSRAPDASSAPRESGVEAATLPSARLCERRAHVMAEELPIQRRLAAILAADITGYSRLMHEDEPATVRDLKAHQSVILPLIGRHGGRIIDTAGDGIMAEFPSVIGAVECAVEIQTVMAERNLRVSESRRMRFRIGINLGDVIHDETRIYGDGINIAARLEALAPPGGVLVSNTVYDQVRGKLPLTFEDVGEREVKNIERPVRMYQLHVPGASSEAVATIPIRRPASTDRRRWIVWGLAAFVVLLGAGGAWWIASPFLASSTEAPRLSIVVLPFSNLSGDPSQDYFADGITEDLTSDLSRIAGSFVISGTLRSRSRVKPWMPGKSAASWVSDTCSRGAYAGWEARSASMRSSSTRPPARICGPNRWTSTKARWRISKTTSASRIGWHGCSVSSSSMSRAAGPRAPTRMRWTSPCVAGRS